MKVTVRAGMILLVLLTISTTSFAQTASPDLSGTWTQKSGPNPGNVETIQIDQSSSLVQVTEKYGTKAQKPDRVLRFYTDARGESNLTSDGRSYLQSRTKWIGDTLFTQWDSLSKPPAVNERYDEWTLSKDGTTITITSTFTTNGPQSMRRSSLGRPDISTHQSTRKRVFKKLS